VTEQATGLPGRLAALRRLARGALAAGTTLAIAVYLVLPPLWFALFGSGELASRYLGQPIIRAQIGALAGLVLYRAVLLMAANRQAAANEALIRSLDAPLRGPAVRILSAELEAEAVPLSYMSWILPVSGFIGTVIGVSLAIAPLGALIDATGGIDSAAIGEVLSGLNLAFDTTLFGLLAVIPAMALSYSVDLAIGRRIARLWALV